MELILKLWDVTKKNKKNARDVEIGCAILKK